MCYNCYVTYVLRLPKESRKSYYLGTKDVKNVKNVKKKKRLLHHRVTFFDSSPKGVEPRTPTTTSLATIFKSAMSEVRR